MTGSCHNRVGSKLKGAVARRSGAMISPTYLASSNGKRINPSQTPGMGKSTQRVSGLIVAVCLAALALDGASLLRPMIVYDDFTILVNSLTWQAARASL